MTKTDPKTGATMERKPPFVRNPYNYDMNKASDETAIACKDPSLTQQQFVEESDINFIADKFGLTGEMPQVLTPPTYGDFSGIFDFQTANNSIIAANRKFMELPAKLRSRFDNNPQKLIEFLADEGNRKEAEFLGLTQTKEPDHATGSTQAPETDAKDRPGTPRATAAAAKDDGSQESGRKTAKDDRRGNSG